MSRFTGSSRAPNVIRRFDLAAADCASFFFFSPKYSAGTGCNNVEVPGQPATIFFSATLNDVTPGPRHIPSNGLAASIIPHVKGFGCVSL